MSDSAMRLARFLAKAGVASRRKSEEFISAGRVKVNGACITTPAFTVDPAHDTVTFDGKPLTQERHVYYLLNKPPGYTCTASDPHADKLAIALLDIPQDRRVYNVGRLDRESEGLLLFTNDGDLTNRLLHPRYEVRKTYRVWVTGHVQPMDLARLRQGVVDQGETLVAKEARVIKQQGSTTILEIVVSEGKNHEVRRMCASMGYHVDRLLRTRFGPLRLDTLKQGEFRPLTDAEITALRQTSEPG